MRLIDADVFAEISKKHVPEIIENTWDEGYIECLKVVDETPTVKAITIEWIEKKIQYLLMNRNFRWATDFQEVIDMWKVENNIPLFEGEIKITMEKENETDH